MSHERGKTVKGSAKRIRKIREDLQLSQERMGALLGVAGNTVARWERDYLTPPKIAELAAEYLLLTRKPGGEKDARKK